MKLRLLPVVITIIVSSLVLFGGWNMYQSIAMEDPFLEHVASVEGVTEPTVVMSRDQAIVKVKVSQGASLKDVYQGIIQAGQDSLGGRLVTVQAEGGNTEALDEWWSKALFDVAQAMETKQYSLIPDRLQQRAEASGTVSIVAEMDETNVYISIYEGSNSKYVILPRMAPVMGVWPNE